MTRPPKKPIDGRAVAEGVGRALDAPDPLIPIPNKSLSEDMLDRAMREHTEEDGGNRRFVQFGEDWRAFIRRQTPDRLAAFDEVVDEHLERRALRRFWARTYKLAIVVVPIGWAWAQGFFEKAMPFIRNILKAIQGAQQ